MTTVKFDKSVKYRGIRYSAHEAFEVEDSDVAQLKKSGATILSHLESTPSNTNEIIAENGSESEKDNAEIKEQLLTYSVAKLIEFAKEHNINLQGKTRKSDIYNIIVSTL